LEEAVDLSSDITDDDDDEVVNNMVLVLQELSLRNVARPSPGKFSV
jgi:hypothetical protein